MKKISIYVCYLLLFTALTITGCAKLQNKAKENERIEENQLVEEKQDEEPQPETTSASIAAIGDVLLHGTVYKDAQTGDSFNFDKMFTEVKPYLEAADITLANQESMIGGKEIGLSAYPSFNSPFEIGDTLQRSGVDIVSIANNHTLDRGEKAILNALNHWDEIGMPYVGAYRSEDDRASIRTIEKNGIMFSFLAYTYGTNGIPVPEGKPYLVNLIDKEKIQADIQKAKELSDVVVVSMHFGNEYERMPNESQKELAQFIADAGAHIIFGHHPHVLQPVDFIRSKEGHDTFVAYSLGNFLAAQEAKHDYHRRIGGIVQVEVEKVKFGDETTIRVHSPSFLPTFIHLHNWRNFRIMPMANTTNKEMPNAQKQYEDTKKHMQQLIPYLAIMDDKKEMVNR